jgi:5'-phosphate synthase pdxT subunit
MIGVLALQGGFAEHEAVLRALGLEFRELRSMDDVEGLTGLILPGGESTVMLKFLREFGLMDWLHERAAAALRGEFKILGTCAGLIVLAKEGLLDVTVERNAYGRQLSSFVAELSVGGVPGLRVLRAHFIRAPKITRVGEGVQVLAEHAGVPVLLRQAGIWAASCHPELAGDAGLHRAIFA